MSEKESMAEFEAAATTPMNLLTNPERTTRAMAEIEGEWFLKASGTYSLAGAKKYLDNDSTKQDREKVAAIPDKTKRLKFILDSYAFQVYGGGGFNRWLVYPNGDVRFSGHHNHDEKVREKVKSLCFEIT